MRPILGNLAAFLLFLPTPGLLGQLLIDSVAGGASLDGQSALTASLELAIPGALGPEGTLYFASGWAIYRIDTGGFIRLVAGTGTPRFSGDGGRPSPSCAAFTQL